MRFRNIILSISLIVTLTGITSCHDYDRSISHRMQHSKRAGEPATRIIVKYSECTDCLGGYVLEGTVLVPPDLRRYFSDTLKTNDIVLAGNFPFDLVDNTRFSYESGLTFNVTGKLIGVEPINGAHSPVFYVEEWEAIKDTTAH